MNIILKIIKKILFLLTTLAILIISTSFLLKNGITIDNIKITSIKFEKLYIKLDKKLIVKANEINFTKNKKTDIHNLLLSFSKNVIWIKRLFKEIDLKKVHVNNEIAQINYKDGNFSFLNNRLNLNLEIISQNTINDIIKINQFKFENFNIKGIIKANFIKKYYIFNGNFTNENINGKINIDLKKHNLIYTITDTKISSFPKLVKEINSKFRINRELLLWLNRLSNGKNYFIQKVKGKIDLRKNIYFLNNIFAIGKFKDIKLILGKDLYPINIKNADLVLKNGELNIDTNSSYQNQILDTLKIKIYNIFSNKAGLILNIKFKGLFDEKINKILENYKINSHIIQKSGNGDFNINLDINFNPFNVTNLSLINLNDANVLLNNKEIYFKKANIKVKNDKENKIYIDFIDSGFDFIKMDGNTSIDLDNKNGLLEGEIVNLEFNDGILNLKNKKINANFNFNNSLNIYFNNLKTIIKLGDKKEININSSEDIIKNSILAKTLNIKNFDSLNILSKDFKNYEIKFRNLEIDSPLLKDLKPYNKDDFEISIKDKNISGNNKDKTFNFKYIDKKLDVQLSNLDINATYFKDEKNSLDINSSIKGDNSAFNFNNYLINFKTYDVVKNNNFFKINGEIGKKAKLNFIKNKNFVDLNITNLNSNDVNKILNNDIFANGTFKIKILGKNFNNLKGEVIIKNTYLKDFKSSQNLLSLINIIPSIISLKGTKFNNQGFSVKNARILFQIKNNILKILGLKLEGSSADISGFGTIDLATEEINIKLELKLLKDANSIISNIPLINQLILGKNRSISTLIKIKGNLSKPIYETQILQDTILSPLKIIRNIIEAPFFIFNKQGAAK